MFEEEVINFYSVNDEFGELSSFSPYSIRLDGDVPGEHGRNAGSNGTANTRMRPVE